MTTKEEMYELIDHIWLILCNRRRLSMVTRHIPDMNIEDWIKLQKRNIEFINRQIESDAQVLKTMTRWYTDMLPVVLDTAQSHAELLAEPYDITDLQTYRVLLEEHERTSMR